MAQLKVFLDTDVVISALLSQKGASFELITKTPVDKIISKEVKLELTEVSKRYKIKAGAVKKIVENLEVVSFDLTGTVLSENYSRYVSDPEDAHVVAGADQSDSRFLLSHNTRHYNLVKVKNELDIIVTKPGIFLQYLRSRN